MILKNQRNQLATYFLIFSIQILLLQSDNGERRVTYLSIIDSFIPSKKKKKNIKCLLKLL